MNYKKIAELILENIGGEANIYKVTHCFTRLRLDLKDNEQMNQKAINDISIVKGSQINNGQLQIIIGNDVDEVYEEFIKMTNVETSTSSQNEKEETLLGKFIDLITSIFIPIFPALVAGGLMKGILIAIQFSQIMDTSGTTFALLSMFSDAPFYFLPIILAYSTAKKFDCNPYIAVVIAGIMLHPTYATLGEDIKFLGINMSYINYSSTVFPILIGVYFMSWIEKGIKRISPKSLSMLLVPLLTIFITAPIILIVIGPIANQLAIWVGDGVIWLFNHVGILAGAIIGAIYPFLVFTGLHQAIPPIELQNLAQSGIDPILAVAACANAAIAGATLMVFIKSKKQDTKSLAGPSALSAFIGITEPALYGIISHYKTTFVATFIGGGLGGAFVAWMGVQAIGMGPVPLAGIAVFFGEKFIWYLIGICISAIAAMAVVAILGFDEKSSDGMNTSHQDEIIIDSPMRGQIQSLSSVNDSTFSNEIMGKGIAIKPTEGKVYAPFDAKVNALFKTKHAIGLTSDGIDLIIHVGLETVKLEGQYFEAHVSQGDFVKKGDLLLSFDIKTIQSLGYDCITPVIIANTSDFKDIKPLISEKNTEPLKPLLSLEKERTL